MQQFLLPRVSARLYCLSPQERTDRPILAAITGKNSTLLVDAGNSADHAELFLQHLTRAAVRPPDFVALTHWHWDHVFGLAALRLPTFAHRETKLILEEMATLEWSDDALEERVRAGTEIEFCREKIRAEFPDPRRTQIFIPPPNIAFYEHIELDLGRVLCHIDHIGGDHASDSSVISVPEEGVVFLGDCLYPDIYHGPWSYTTQKLFPLLDQLIRYEADFYIDAHNPEPIARAEFLEYATLLKIIGQTVDHLGDDRQAVLTELSRIVERPLTDHDLELVDAFLAGIRKPAYQSLHTWKT
jgi:glyoxylase-like metal-dependent hydrolase (beta-lactamase superfamily II)